MEEVRRGYKQTEVGVIPVDWEVKPISEVFYFTGGKAHEQFIVPFGKYIVINSKFVASDGSVKKYASTSVCSPKRNSIALVMSDLPNGKALGKCFLVDEDERYVLNQRVCALTARRDFPPYLFYALNRNKYFLSFNDGVSQTHLLNPIVLNCPVLLPSSQHEQRAIATALSDVDALLAGLDALIAKKKAIKQGTMQRLLTGKQRLPGFEGEWEVKRLGEVARIEMGRTPSRLNPAYWGRGHLWISIGDMHTKVISRTKEEITDLAASGMRVIPRGTLIMSFKLSIGRLAFTGQDMFSNEAICSFNDLNADAQFLYYMLGRTDFSLYGKQAVKGFTLNKESLRSVEVNLPNRKEQTAIAEVLSDMDAELEALEARRAKTALLKQGMMQELLTGRIRLV